MGRARVYTPASYGPSVDARPRVGGLSATAVDVPAPPSPAATRKYLLYCPAVLALVILAAGISTAVLLSTSARDAQSDKIEDLFVTHAGSMVGAIDAELTDLANGDDAACPVSYAEFTALTQQLRANLPFVFSVSYSPRVLHANREQFENASNALLNDELERLGHDRLDVRVAISYQLGSGSTTRYGEVPAVPPQDEYFPILFWSFFPAFEASFMFDVAAASPDNSRRADVAAAVESGQPRATAPFALLGTTGVLVVFPVLLADGSVGGVVNVVMLTDGLSELGLSPLAATELALVVEDAGAEPSFVFAVAINTTSSRFEAGPRSQVAAVAASAEFSATSQLVVFGRRWSLSTYTYDRFVSHQRSNEPTTILVVVMLLVFGMCVSLVFIGLYGASRHSAHVAQHQAASRLVAERSRVARESFESTLAYLSHELRNPLHACGAALAFLLGPSDPEESLTETQQRDVQTIATALEQMQRLVNDTLDAARLKQGALTIRPSAVRLAVLMDTLLHMFAAFTKPGVTFCTSVGPGVPPVVRLDDLRVRQVLCNGITNALKNTHRGYVVVQVSKPTADTTLLFQVMDTGVGVHGVSSRRLMDPTYAVPPADWPPPPNTVGHLVKPPPPPPSTDDMPGLRRRPSSDAVGAETRRALSGSGFGLPISLQLARAMGGWCGLQNRTGSESGSVFWVELPYTLSAAPPLRSTLSLRSLQSSETVSAATSPCPPRVAAHPPPAAGAGVPSRPAAASPSHAPATPPAPGRRLEPLGLRVLVVDDERINRRLAKRMLGRLRCSVVLLDDGAGVEAALAATHQLPASLQATALTPAASPPSPPFDVVLMDVQMPILCGDEVCRKLRAAGLTHLPIVAMTANCTVADRQRYAADGFTQVLAKPFDMAQLSLLLRSVFVRPSAAPASPKPAPSPSVV